MSRPLTRSTIDVCADCSNQDPTWVSVNRGVLLCDGCCSIHLSLGRHVSQIKSMKKASWSPQQLTMVHQLVNCGANNIWEHSLLVDPTQNRTGRRKPNPREPIHPVKADFIRAKYQFLTYVNKHKDSEIITADDLNKQLHASVRTGNLETSLRLLAAGADPNFIYPEKGTTALHVATISNQASQVELLLVYGADPGCFDINGNTAAKIARLNGNFDLADRLVEAQYELTDGLAFYLCNRRPDHRAGQHFIIPEVTDSHLDLSELAKAAKKKLQALSNHLFEELAMDVYDEVDRRENERIWLLTQSSSNMLVSERQIVPFLPANPEFSATRNQGRQKLAKFNKREFATLIIDILNDAKRRYAGFLSPSSSKKALNAKDKSGSKPGGGGDNLSDDEPLYDSVCSDEDYASIGDNQSLKDESNDKTSSKDGINDKNIDLSDHSDLTGVSDENAKRRFSEAQRKIRELESLNQNLTEEVARLKNTVKLLLQENYLLRCGTSPVEVPSSVNYHNLGPNALGSHPRWTTNIETSELQRFIYHHQEFPSPPTDFLLLNDMDFNVDTNDSTIKPRGRRDSVDLTPTDAIPPPAPDGTGLSSIFGASGSTTDQPSLPKQDEVVKKTEKITRSLQELFQSAQENKHENYVLCAEKIYASVAEMVTLFSQGNASSSSAKVRDILQLLSTGTDRVKELCAQTPPEVNGAADYRLHTQQIIQSAYDIAKAAKQLVMLFE